MGPMDMVPIPMLVLAMDMEDMLLPMPTTERGLLMPSLRPRLMLTMELTDAGLGYARYGYGAYGLGYAGYAAPYAYGAYYGKRSADAEPKADAYYGAYGYAGLSYGYGYPRAYGYGAYPYAYGAYAYGK